MPGQLMLVDSASLWFRAFYGVPVTVTSPDGQPINAVRGFLDHLARLLHEHRPGGFVACLDVDWRPTFRVEAVPTYKAHRVAVAAGEDGDADLEEVPDELSPQVELIVQVLEAIGLATAGAAGYEADDVIGTLAARSAVPVDIVTGDRDLFQVVRPGVRVLYTVDKGRPYDDAAVAAKYAIPHAAAYADFALLRGDPSDGLPGVPGIGAKTAAALLTEYGTLGALLAALDRGERVPAGPKLAAARDYLAAAEPVMAVRTDVVLPRIDPALPTAPADPDALAMLVARYGLAAPVRRLSASIRDCAAG
ncbi:MAG TPA: 5'-3' exonuclease [Mycobacteriales bacterium]|jgi:5'-3' exonuclease|nr:5'-3' exonuclease [Mycobacteriales bacterium]